MMQDRGESQKTLRAPTLALAGTSLYPSVAF